MNRVKTGSTGLAPLKSTTTLVTDPQEKAEILLNEFSSVFTVEDTNSIPWLGPAKNQIDDIAVTEEGVSKLLANIKPHKASGPDKIANRVLKELHSELAPIMTALFNQSLSTGSIPSDWSNALITPVYKKGNVHVAANYRPVSLTCVACKPPGAHSLLSHYVFS